MPFQEQTQKLLGTNAYEYYRSVAEVALGDDVVDQLYGATVTLARPGSQALHTFYRLTALTGNITINIPPGRVGQRITLLLVQDGTGGRTITWGAGGATIRAAANGAGTANQAGATSFIFGGTSWVQESGPLTFK